MSPKFYSVCLLFLSGLIPGGEGTYFYFEALQDEGTNMGLLSSVIV